MKREKLVNQYYELRKELKAKGDYEALRKLPRDSSPTRLTRRCKVTGRPRGVLRKFEMSRIALENMHTKDKYLVSKIKLVKCKSSTLVHLQDN